MSGGVGGVPRIGNIFATTLVGGTSSSPPSQQSLYQQLINQHISATQVFSATTQIGQGYTPYVSIEMKFGEKWCEDYKREYEAASYAAMVTET